MYPHYTVAKRHGYWCNSSGDHSGNPRIAWAVGYHDGGTAAAVTSAKFYPGTGPNFMAGSRLTMTGVPTNV